MHSHICEGQIRMMEPSEISNLNATIMTADQVMGSTRDNRPHEDAHIDLCMALRSLGKLRYTPHPRISFRRESSVGKRSHGCCLLPLYCRVNLIDKERSECHDV